MHFSITIPVLLLLLAGTVPLVGAEDPETLTRERRSPWGTVLQRYTYYLDGEKEVRHGMSETFYADGKPLARAEHRHGKLHGTLTSYYRGLGTKASENQFREGKQHGKARDWSPQGELLFECEYRDGQAWEGRIMVRGTSSSGAMKRSREIETVGYAGGNPIKGSERTFKTSYDDRPHERPPDIRAFIRWKWISYRIDSDYPFLEELPPREKVPFLIDWCAEGRDSRNVAHSQLVALTRVDLGEMNSDDQKERQAEIDAWRDWWKSSGHTREKLDREQGERDAEAWKLVARGRELALPEGPIALPEAYTIELRFSSGDYLGKVKERLTLKRDADGASLERVFSTRTDGPETTERWQPFSPADADRTARAIAYLIDHPWLQNDEVAIQRQLLEALEKSNGKSVPSGPAAPTELAGRESFSLYYPSASYTMEDGDGHLWWNDDPWSWHGGNELCFNSAAQPLLSSVYPFFVSLYPESTRGDGQGQAGWVEIE